MRNFGRVNCKHKLSLLAEATGFDNKERSELVSILRSKIRKSWRDGETKFWRKRQDLNL